MGFERAVLHGMLLVATDGLLAYAPTSAVAESTCATTNLDEVARQLLDRIRLPGGDLMDDVALVLVRTPTVSRNAAGVDPKERIFDGDVRKMSLWARQARGYVEGDGSAIRLGRAAP